jgi:hypothetical protein
MSETVFYYGELGDFVPTISKLDIPTDLNFEKPMPLADAARASGFKLSALRTEAHKGRLVVSSTAAARILLSATSSPTSPMARTRRRACLGVSTIASSKWIISKC